jgi:hypothetical protein
MPGRIWAGWDQEGFGDIISNGPGIPNNTGSNAIKQKPKPIISRQNDNRNSLVKTKKNPRNLRPSKELANVIQLGISTVPAKYHSRNGLEAIMTFEGGFKSQVTIRTSMTSRLTFMAQK